MWGIFLSLSLSFPSGPHLSLYVCVCMCIYFLCIIFQIVTVDLAFQLLYFEQDANGGYGLALQVPYILIWCFVTPVFYF